MKKWKLMPGNPGKAKHIEEELGVPALVSEVLVARGIDTPAKAENFISKFARYSYGGTSGPRTTIPPGTFSMYFLKSSVTPLHPVSINLGLSDDECHTHLILVADVSFLIRSP